MAKSPTPKDAFRDLLKSLKLYRPSSYTPILAILLIIASFLVGVLFTKVQYLEKNGATVTTNVGDTETEAAPTVSIDTIKGLFKEGNIVFGDANKKNLFVEVADPSCPWCHVAGGHNPSQAQAGGLKYASEGGDYVPAVPEMKKLVDSGEAAFVWIYTNGHGAGEMTTKAFYCAYEQNKFWEVHDLLMTSEGYDLINNVVKNDTSKTSDLVNFIGNVVNTQELTNCIDSGKYDSKLEQDQNLASSIGVQATPGFYVNTTLYGGAYSWTDMEASLTK